MSLFSVFISDTGTLRASTAHLPGGPVSPKKLLKCAVEIVKELNFYSIKKLPVPMSQLAMKQWVA